MVDGKFIFPFIGTSGGGGEDPLPEIFCPTNGFYDPDDPNSPVVWKPIKPEDGWFLITSFQTNSGNATTFDPTISSSSGQFAWDLGDGTYILYDKAISHTYADSTTKTVKLYGKGTCNITTIDFSGDNIVGALDLSHSAFITCGGWSLFTNTGLTSISFPSSSITGNVNALHIYSTGIVGTLDLSKFTTFSNTATISLGSNPAMTGITWASSISGTFSQISITSTGLTGVLDMSKFTTFTTAANIQIHTNASLTGITFASAITGLISNLLLHSNGIIGTLDLSMFSSWTTTSSIGLNNNMSMTGITWASTITGTFTTLNIYTTGIVGILDLSKFTSFSSSASLNLYGNASVTGITFAAALTGTFSLLYIYSTGITGTLDLSMFTSWTATATAYLNNNTALTNITFPASTITGFIRTLRLYSNTSLGYVNFSTLRTGLNSLNWDMKNNGWSAAIVNQTLATIAGISAAGFTSRAINIGGTNADPDTTSGGYNGAAARTTLINYAFVVTIT